MNVLGLQPSLITYTNIFQAQFYFLPNPMYSVEFGSLLIPFHIPGLSQDDPDKEDKSLVIALMNHSEQSGGQRQFQSIPPLLELFAK